MYYFKACIINWNPKTYNIKQHFFLKIKKNKIKDQWNVLFKKKKCFQFNLNDFIK